MDLHEGEIDSHASGMVGACRDVAQGSQPRSLHSGMMAGIERSGRADHPLSGETSPHPAQSIAAQRLYHEIQGSCGSRFREREMPPLAIVGSKPVPLHDLA